MKSAEASGWQDRQMHHGNGGVSAWKNSGEFQAKYIELKQRIRKKNRTTKHKKREEK
jgi:hypothetical protein